MTILYNLIMAVVDLAVLGIVRAGKGAGWLRMMTLAAAAGGIGSMLLAQGPFPFFHFARLAAYGLFLHGLVLLAGSAVILWPTRRRLAIGCAAAALGLVGVTIDAFLIEPTWLEVSHREIPTAKLDRRLRIVFLADLQTDRIGPYEEMALRRAMAEKPDLILLGGDYLHPADPGEDVHTLYPALNKLVHDVHLAAPLGVFAVCGNMEDADWPTIFQGLDVHAAAKTHGLDVGPLRLTCLSRADSFDPGLAVARPRSEQFHLVLGHAPNFALGRIEADLLLAGHTHGGQVCLPGIGPLTSLSAVPRSMASGQTELSGGQTLIVARGVGMERGRAPRFRFLCRPELAVIDLVPAKPTTEGRTER